MAEVIDCSVIPVKIGMSLAKKFVLAMSIQLNERNSKELHRLPKNYTGIILICQLICDGGEGTPCCFAEWWDAGVVVSGSRCRFAYDPANATATHCLLLQ